MTDAARRGTVKIEPFAEKDIDLPLDLLPALGMGIAQNCGSGAQLAIIRVRDVNSRRASRGATFKTEIVLFGRQIRPGKPGEDPAARGE